MPPESIGRLEAMSPCWQPRRRAGARSRAATLRRDRASRTGRRAALDEHALVPGLRREAHAQAPPGVARRGARGRRARLHPLRAAGRRRAPAPGRRPSRLDELDVRLDDRHRSCRERRSAERASSHARRRVARPPIPHRALATSMTARRSRRDAATLLGELRSMKGLIEERFGALAFMEKLQRRRPRRASRRSCSTAASRRR